MIKSLLSLAFVASTAATPLDDYVWAPDAAYGWTDMNHIITGTNLFRNRSWTGYTLNMTSQRWLTDADFSDSSDAKSLWWHYLVVIVPDKVDWDRNASLWVTGWDMKSTFPEATDEDIALAASLAMGLNQVMGALFQIPNEHITFSADPLQKSRSEDSIIAFTWDHFLKNTSDPNWLVRFPMVKATLRAMDAVKEFMQYKFPAMESSLDYFTVAGASKRGWTTWDVGAVDKERVVAIVPVVLDAINFVSMAHHQFRKYGGWSWALSDYYEMNIMTRLDIPEMTLLCEYEDPYFYKERLTMPKLVVNAVLDEFQNPDDTYYWWNEMPEPKHFLMTPNAEHSEATGILEIVPAIGTWINYLLYKQEVPEFTWTISPTTGEIVVTLNDVGEVHEASVWYGNSCGTNLDGIKRRDFRIISLDSPCECGVLSDGYCLNVKSFWTREVLTESIVDGKRTYSAHFDAPTDGTYIAYFIDVKYVETPKMLAACERLPCDKPGRLEFTSEVSIWPNTFPYEDCYAESCTGSLV